jgi:formamidopyrimidine-DNA glycosylase
MPELAEVERGRRLLEDAILGKQIVEVTTQEDALVFVDNAASTLEKALPGRTVLAVNRHGKNIYLKLDKEGPTLAFHLGSTFVCQCRDAADTHSDGLSRHPGRRIPLSETAVYQEDQCFLATVAMEGLTKNGR